MGRKYGYGGENRGGTFGLTIISNMIFITENQVLNTWPNYSPKYIFCMFQSYIMNVSYHRFKIYHDECSCELIYKKFLPMLCFRFF